MIMERRKKKKIQAQISREINKEMQHIQPGKSEKINIITAIKNKVFNGL